MMSEEKQKVGGFVASLQRAAVHTACTRRAPISIKSIILLNALLLFSTFASCFSQEESRAKALVGEGRQREIYDHLELLDAFLASNQKNPQDFMFPPLSCSEISRQRTSSNDKRQVGLRVWAPARWCSSFAHFLLFLGGKTDVRPWRAALLLFAFFFVR